jgi:hypothetical protein
LNKEILGSKKERRRGNRNREKRHVRKARINRRDE